jgi:hypothetical protein
MQPRSLRREGWRRIATAQRIPPAESRPMNARFTLALVAALSLGHVAPAQAAPSTFVLRVNAQATLADVRIGVYNIRESDVAGADGKTSRALTAAVRVYFRDPRNKDLAMRAHVGTQFTASGHQYEVIAIDPHKGVAFTMR